MSDIKKPDSFDEYLKDIPRHKYFYTTEAHEWCKAYEQQEKNSLHNCITTTAPIEYKLTTKELMEGNYFVWLVIASMGFGIDQINKDNHYTHIDFKQPIKLTKEWLIDFGFKNWGDKYTYSKKKFIIHKRKRGFVIRKSIPVVEYVHQLQNAFFLMTGEHLTLSKEKYNKYFIDSVTNRED